MTGAKIRFALALLAFVSWLGVLAWTVAGNGKIAVVSRAQLSAASSLIVVDLTIDGQGLPAEMVTVQQTIHGKPVTGQVQVSNLPSALAAGTYKTPTAGVYLIPVVMVSETQFKIAGLPPSTGVSIPQPLRPTIYPWNEDVKKQLKGWKIL